MNQWLENVVVVFLMGLTVGNQRRSKEKEEGYFEKIKGGGGG